MIEEKLQTVGKKLDEGLSKVDATLDRAREKLERKFSKIKSKVRQEIELSSLSLEDKVRLIKVWQDAGCFPQLNCVTHHLRNLQPVITSDTKKLVLICPFCLFAQENIPREVLLGIAHPAGPRYPLSLSELKDLPLDPNPDKE